MTEAVHYRVSMSKPHTHLFEVEAYFPPTESKRTVQLPAWTPGSYLIREFARHIQDLVALDSSQTPLEVQRLDKQTFEVDAPNQAVCFRYRVYANELTVRTSHLDGTHGYFNGATLFVYAEALRAHPHRVEVVPYQDWTIFTALDQDIPPSTWVASSYDELIDSPFEVGPHTPVDFVAAGVPHRLVIWGESPVESRRLTADLQTVCEAEAKLFGGLPLKRYLFLLYLTDKGRGGLEHKSSTALLFPRSGLANQKGWQDFLTLAAHEYFHLWNIKRIKPRALVPFNYQAENYTRLLWAFEGCTSYYDNLMVRRSGQMSAAHYLNRLGETLTTLHATPGRKVQTLADASFYAWIKHYRPDENSNNSSISYYLKGEVVAVLLDLTLRQSTGDARSLDDLMRMLWQRYGDESGVPEDAIEAIATELAGADLKPFFDRAIRTTHELDYTPLMAAGLELKFRPRESTTDKGGTAPRTKGEAKPKGWLGIQMKGSSNVASVTEGSPAMHFGIYPDDELLAIDGYKAESSSILARCEEKKPGEMIRLTLFRRDRLLDVQVTLGAKPSDAAYLCKVDLPSPAQKALYENWLGESWNEHV